MEKRDLYDKNRNLTHETLLACEAIPKDRYIVVVLVFIENFDGKFLIQKRSKEKNGLYATTGGHPKSGESSIEGIITEVKEEIGLTLKKDDINLYYSNRSDKQRVFFDDYYIKIDVDINHLKLEKKEVESIHWFSKEEIKELYDKDKFMKNHYKEFERLLDWLEKRN